MSTERRRHQRFSIMAHVRVTCDTVNHVLDVTNISLSGVFISTLGLPPTAEFRTGQPIELNIFLSESTENVRVFGRIVRTVERDDPPASGFGVEFDNVDDKARLGITLLVEIARSSEAPGPPPLPTSNLGR